MQAVEVVVFFSHRGGAPTQGHESQLQGIVEDLNKYECLTRQAHCTGPRFRCSKKMNKLCIKSMI